MWILILALGIVVGTIRHLHQPQTAEKLGVLFAPVEAAEELEQAQVVMPSGKDSPPSQAKPPSPAAPAAVETEAEADGDPLTRVRDNTYFRPAESEAWFELIAKLQVADAQQLQATSLGELTYAQLVKQPQVYRGKVVTLRGTARREEEVEPAENSLVLSSYHRLVLQPAGGGQWPFVVYCLQLPAEFPRGESIQASVEVTGYFFKNWSYAWEDGLGVAPVVLAKGVSWQPIPTGKPRSTIPTVGLAALVGGAAVLAGMVIWLAVRNSRSPNRSRATQAKAEESTTTIHEQLQQLEQTEATHS